MDVLSINFIFILGQMDVASLLSGISTNSGTINTIVQSVPSDTMFSSGTLIASFIVSTIGFSYFIYGKKQSKIMVLISGLLLMGFPYFVHDIRYIIYIALVLCVLPFIVRF